MRMKGWWWLVFAVAQIATASGDDLWRAIQRRYEALVGRQITWHVDIEASYRISPSDLEAIPQLQQRSLHNNSYNIKANTVFTLFVYNKELGLLGRLPYLGINTSLFAGEFYMVFSDDYGLLAEGELSEMSYDSFKEKTSIEIPLNTVYIWKPSKYTLPLANPTGSQNLAGQPSQLSLLFIAGLDPRRLSGLSWRVVDILKDRVLIESEVGRQGLVRVWYGRGSLSGVPLRMEVDLGEGGVQYYETIQTARIDGLVNIQQFTCRIKGWDNSTVNLKFTLKTLDKNNQSIFAPIPHRISVFDYRHLGENVSPKDLVSENAVNYSWEGKLIPDEKIRYLAYQQGNLVPPDTPRRRFSPLLFAPAIVFFALAAYFYFRNRRR